MESKYRTPKKINWKYVRELKLTEKKKRNTLEMTNLPCNVETTNNTLKTIYSHTLF